MTSTLRSRQELNSTTCHGQRADRRPLTQHIGRRVGDPALDQQGRDVGPVCDREVRTEQVGARQVRAAQLRAGPNNGIAQFAGAATAPAHRRHGIQSALLAARLADATAAGCDLAVVTTQPASKSHQNAQRAGFDLLYTRLILVKNPT